MAACFYVTLLISFPFKKRAADHQDLQLFASSRRSSYHLLLRANGTLAFSNQPQHETSCAYNPADEAV